MSTGFHGDVALLMFVTLGLLLFVGLPVAFVLTGVGLAFGLIGYAMGLVRPGDVGFIVHRVFGTLAESEDIRWSAVPMLIFMGAVLERSGVAREALLGLQAWLRRVPGGLAIAITLIGVVLAPMAGMIGASVATLGLMMLPVMLEEGYRPSFAAGSVAAAGTLGVGLPPGIMLVFIAEAMGVQVPVVFLAMVGPALVLLALYTGYFVVAGRRPRGRPSAGRATVEGGGGRPIRALRRVLPLAALMGLVLGSIVAGWASLAESAALGALGAVLLGRLSGRLTLGRLHEAVERTTVMTAMVFFIVVGASVFSLVFRLLGGIDRVTAFLGGLGFGPWGTLMLVLGVIFVLGCFLDWLEIILVSFAIVRPVLDRLDFAGHVDPPYLAFGWITILVALTLQSSFLTPPFGFALVFARGASPPGVRLADIYRGIVPFVVIQLLVIGCVAAYPAITTWLPAHVLHVPAQRGIRAYE